MNFSPALTKNEMRPTTLPNVRFQAHHLLDLGLTKNIRVGDRVRVQIRVEALRWIHQALSDIDRAIETGHHDTAKRLLHRVQDVLDLPAVSPDVETR